MSKIDQTTSKARLRAFAGPDEVLAYFAQKGDPKAFADAQRFVTKAEGLRRASQRRAVASRSR